MKSEDIIDLGNELECLNDDNLSLRVKQNNDVQNIIHAAITLAEHSRAHVTKDELPTEGNLLSLDKWSNEWKVVSAFWINYNPDRFAVWIYLPESAL